ncbi:hypothetical protein I302_106879 [Kwoniella bestiolae CBS 10118]|uniref:Uncharacterized protein n=1 Tax=Kwoniella bestiolae CBS 10118 TaxID=1296100 RepID=A0A1B9G057_9TREE|nr:hypothetical protein I302_05855 [Kwoniella bestiolae CBS 10118]OCF24395.1 hypothetical protein I302_05855 [Kwoniella bestiolae CBS 10118]
MDYLTILSTRSLILFPPSHILPSSLPLHRPLPSSPLSSPTSPTIILLPPEPIALPLSSLVYNETNCAYYLVHHVLSTTQPFSQTHTTQDRGIQSEVEVIVAKELDRVRIFVRDLGRWFSKSLKNGGMEEGELKELAGRFGLAVEGVDHRDDGGHGLRGDGHGYSISKGETMVLV